MRVLFIIARLKLIQILVFGCMFSGVFYFTLYNDGSRFKKEIKGVEINISQVSANVKKKEQELENLKIFEQDIHNEEVQVKHFLNFIPTNLTYTDVSTLLINESKSSGVNIEFKQDEQNEIKAHTEYQTLNILMKISGSFRQTLLFLSRLTDQKKILIVHHINMKTNNENQLIETKLSISAYRYHKKAEVKE